jgi:uncharacterized protein YgbK (DUF1537 family)
MTTARPLALAYVGDDFTGSTDALEQLARAGLRTALFTEIPDAEQLAAVGPVDAIGIAAATRPLAPAAMEAQLRPIFTALRTLGPRHVHYKVCSTFDSAPHVGSIGRALEVGASVFGGRFVPLVVGAPPLGRYCAFGNLFARMGIGSAGEIHRLDRHPSMSRHPVTPADEADLRLHLAKQTATRCGLIDFLQLDAPLNLSEAALDAAAAGRAGAVLFDVLTEAHLARIGALLEREANARAPLFSVGSSAIEMALGAAWAAQGRFARETEWAAPGAADPLLVLSGSCSPVTARQIAWAEANGFALVGLDVGGVMRRECAAFTRAIDGVVAALRGGRSVVLHTSRGETDAALAKLSVAERGSLGAALGGIGREAIARTPVRRVLLAGGDSSSYAAATLGVKALTFVTPLTPGAPLCRAHAPGSPVDGLEVVCKGGQVGPDDFFGRVARGR